jgi:molybdopterin-guanine dinucleotide biosynthesis protein A
MGLPKLALPFGPELMIERIVRIIGGVCPRIVVVAAPGQDLPALPSHVTVAHDQRANRGPLEGLLAGLKAIRGEADAVYVTGCDVPLVVPGFVRRIFDLLGDDTASVPVSDGFHHPLAAVYRPGIVDVIEELLSRDRLRPTYLFDIVATRRVEEKELRDVDPQLNSLKSVNRPEEYFEALKAAGFVAPPGVLDRLRRDEG